MRAISRWALAPLAVALISGCGPKEDKAGAEAKAPEPSSRTLAATLDGGPFDAMGRVADNAGLTTVLEGPGPYTVFAPPEAALKGGGADFTDPALKAEGAALVRSHIVPGAITRADIAAAVERAGANGAQMRTMADTVLTFTKDGDAIIAATADGARARLGEEAVAKNGVAHAVDGLLAKAAATP